MATHPRRVAGPGTGPGRDPRPTAAVIDSQTVRGADTVAAGTTGYDAGKKIKGRKIVEHAGRPLLEVHMDQPVDQFLRIEDAVQVCDELAGNAIVRARAPRGCRLMVAGHGWLRVEVEDASPAPARIRRPDHTGGRGLILVDQLATCWAVDYHGPGKTVWAELGTRGRG